MVSGYAWMDAAACAGEDPDRWFPDQSDTAAIGAAVQVCRGCPVRGQCLEYALRLPLTYGIFGGATPRQRAYLRGTRGISLPKGRQPVAPHGTTAAYRRHYRNGEPPCDACSRAESLRNHPYNEARKAASRAAAPAGSR